MASNLENAMFSNSHDVIICSPIYSSPKRNSTEELRYLVDESEGFVLHRFLKNYKDNGIAKVDVLKNILELHPESASTRNSDGDLPLHLACRRWFPNEIVQLILKANTRAVKEVDGKGNLPLSIACSSHANKCLIITLCKLYPKAASIQNVDGDAPIHLICRSEPEDPPPADCVHVIVQAAPTMVSIPDSGGDILIHKACDWVLSAATLAICENDSFFYWPRNMSELSCSLSSFKYILLAAPSSSATAIHYISKELMESFDQYNHLVTSLALHYILRTANPQKNSSCRIKMTSDRQRLMHMALCGQLKISFEVFTILFGDQWRDAKQITVVENDDKSLPLHIASQYGHDLDPRIIEHLVKLNPRAASTFDCHQKLPLHHAVENGLPLCSVQVIFNAYPVAVMNTFEGKGIQSGFAPALLAASNDASLEVILFLLKEYPMIQNSDEMIDENRERKRI